MVFLIDPEDLIQGYKKGCPTKCEIVCKLCTSLGPFPQPLYSVTP